MVKESELEQQRRLVDEELESLAEEIADIKLSYRGEIDNLVLGQIHPEFDEKFKSIMEKVRLEISPE